MLILLSPAKKLDEKSAFPSDMVSQPAFIEEAVYLADVMKEKDSSDLMKLMGISEKLADLNVERFYEFNTPFTAENARPALFSFKGDVYQKMDVANYSPKQLAFAQKHLRILSGLYGVLRPLDLMQPYRLEMGIPLQTAKGKNLYEFWGSRITEEINASQENAIINLASQEYFGVVKEGALKPKLINIVFKHLKNGELKTFGMLAKRARGQMANYVIENAIIEPEELKKFSEDGYSFQQDFSDDANWVFIKDIEK